MVKFIEKVIVLYQMVHAMNAFVMKSLKLKIWTLPHHNVNGNSVVLVPMGRSMII